MTDNRDKQFIFQINAFIFNFSIHQRILKKNYFWGNMRHNEDWLLYLRSKLILKYIKIENGYFKLIV